MNNTKYKNLIITLLLILICGFLLFFLYSNKTKSINNSTKITDSKVIYSNTDYGFNLSLPSDWKGYSIIKNSWNGYPLNTVTKNETGPIILIRNPKWTNSLHYEDIPIMIFTIAQWNSYISGDFSVSAAPINASELGRNNLYVLALPPRWNFDYSEGYIEAENILKSNPFEFYNIAPQSI